MRRPRFNGSIAVAAAITAALYLPSPAAWAQENAGPEIVIKKIAGGRVLVVQDEASQDEDVDVEVLDVSLQNQLWIGVKLQPLSDVVRSQLGLPEGVGVVVDTVFPDSPAAEAGIQQHDIILSSGDRPIREGAEMVELVAKAAGDELPLTVLRKGKPVDLAVTPTQRPGVTVYAGDAADDVQKTERREFRIVRPGVVLQRPRHEADVLPEGMRIRIEREGGKPDRVMIQRGDDHWDLTDKLQLDDLPEDVRQHVERHLGQPLAAHQFTFEAPLQRSFRWLMSQQLEGDESADNDAGLGAEGDQVWQELEEGGPLPREFNLDRAMEQIDSIRKQFEQLADEQAERTEGLIEEKGAELEETLDDRVTRLEEMLTDRADQLREMIESFFSERTEGDLEVEVEVSPDDSDAAAEGVETEDESEADEDDAADDEIEVEIKLNLESGGDAV